MPLAEALVRELDPQIRSYMQGLESSRDALAQQAGALASQAETLTEQKRALAVELQVTAEKLRLAFLHRFGRSSERSTTATGQVELFAGAEASASDESESSDTVTVASHTKRRPGRNPIDPKLPRFDRAIDNADEDKNGAFGHSLVRIGEEVTERIQVIIEQMWVERVVRPKYACRACEGSGDEDRPAVRIAPAEPAVIPKGIATPSLVAFILVNKFVDHLPFHRQEQRFARIATD